MKKKLFALLLSVVLVGMYSAPITANASYQKRTISEQIVMDSGNPNIVEWQEIGADGDSGTWATGTSNPFVTNSTDTGDSMFIKAY